MMRMTMTPMTFEFSLHVNKIGEMIVWLVNGYILLLEIQMWTKKIITQNRTWELTSIFKA